MMSIADTSASLNSAPTVLLVEDEEALQEIVYDALEEGAFDLTTVSFGRKPWR
jgi:DNA-binding response OmpR family regulator